MDALVDHNRHPRVQTLIDRFRAIDAAMRDLPLYNPIVEIEAIGFRPFGYELLGVVLTPWFMNVTLLPIVPTPMDIGAIGKTHAVELPSGRRVFTVGGDEAIGLYRAHSLHSPVLAFTHPGQARAEAAHALTALMTTSAGEPAPASEAGLNRRTLLFGRRPPSSAPPTG